MRVMSLLGDFSKYGFDEATAKLKQNRKTTALYM
jgi:hypothetical protein